MEHWRRPRLLKPAAGGIWIKVFGLAAIAAVPIVILAGIVIAQTFANSSRLALQTARLLENAAINEFERGEDTLGVLLTIIQIRLQTVPGDCAAITQDELARSSGHVVAFAVINRDDSTRCAVGLPSALSGFPPVGTSDWLDQVRAAGSIQLATINGGKTIVAGLSVDGGAVVAAVLPSSWSNSILPAMNGFNAATWLLDPSGVIVAIRGQASQSVPTQDTMQMLLRTKQAAMLTRSMQGTPFAYASDRLAGGWQLIESYQATRDFESATGPLVTRLVALMALLLMAFAAIIVGAAITFGEPLRRLSGAVSRWQGGGLFEPGSLAGAPWEVREMARSFSDATNALRQREAELARAKEQQDLLVLEIHHRVKNNLQIVASLLNLQASRIRVPEARAEFQAARDRVRALATLHRHLYSEGALNTINMRSFLMELCEQLFQAMGETSDDRITLLIEAPELQMSSDQAVPLALIVTEAVTNSVKYAFPDGRRGRISVRLRENDGTLDLVIQDDGVGMPARSSPMEAGPRDGIGRHLIRGFARQLGASLDVEEGPGTCYAVRLSLKPLGPVETLEPLDAA